MADIRIEGSELQDTLTKISNNIDLLETSLQNILDATNTLDGKKWTAPEKQKLDQDYLPYLQAVAVNIPLALKEKTNLVKNALASYTKLNQDLTNQASTRLEDFSQIAENKK